MSCSHPEVCPALDWVESGCALYFLLIFMAAGLSWVFLPALATHGRSIRDTSLLPRTLAMLHRRTMSKRHFLYFYAIATCMHALLVPGALSLLLEGDAAGIVEMVQQYPFIIHSVRRWIETYIYTRGTRSRMTVLQFIQGILYYCALSIHMCRLQHRIWMPTFLVANIMQGTAHYRVYRMGKQEFSHYYCEILLYLIALCHLRSVCMLLNFLYVLLFVGMTVSSRLEACARRRVSILGPLQNFFDG